MRTPEEAFHEAGYVIHNAARLRHLDGLGVLRPGMRVLEVGAGIGDHTEHLLARGCDVVATEARQENVAILKARFPQASPQLLDLDDPPAVFEGGFDAVLCYGTLYHLSKPAEAIRFMAEKGKLLIMELVVSLGKGEAVNLCEETEDPVHSVRRLGCRPTREWVWGALWEQFEHVYAARTQPDHPEFPTDWAVGSGLALNRAVFVASHVEVVGNPELVDALPMRQERFIEKVGTRPGRRASYSQFGEEKFIFDFFSQYPPKHHTFCDVGAYDGVEFSNTRALFEAGWTGVLVEPLPKRAEILVKNYAGSGCVVLNAAVGDADKRGKMTKMFVPQDGHHDYAATCIPGEKERSNWAGLSWFAIDGVPMVTLREVLSRLGRPVDFLSVDCEGMDIEVLESAGFTKESSLPALIMSEHNDNRNGALQELGRVLAPLGYSKVFDNGLNAGFARVEAAVSIFTPTLGRPSLLALAKEILPQLSVRDEWIIVGDAPSVNVRKIVESFNRENVRYYETAPNHFYGYPQREYAIQRARGSHLWGVDDDDRVAPWALATIRSKIVQHPSRPLMFRVIYSGGIPIWRNGDPTLRIANVANQCFVTPNTAGMLGQWGKRYEGDFDFITSTAARYPEGEKAIVWCPEVLLMQGINAESESYKKFVESWMWTEDIWLKSAGVRS